MKNIIAWELSYSDDELEVNAYSLAVDDNNLFHNLPGMERQPVLVGEDCLYGVQVSDILGKNFVLVCKYKMGAKGLVHIDLDPSVDSWIVDVISNKFLKPQSFNIDDLN